MNDNVEVSIEPIKEQSSWMPWFDGLHDSFFGSPTIEEGEPFMFVVRQRGRKHSEAIQVANEIFMTGIRTGKHVVEMVDEGDVIKITFTPMNDPSERLRRQLANFW